MSIQILRGDTQKIKSSERELLPGQLLLDTTTKELYAGTEDNQLIKDIKPITASNISNGQGRSSLIQQYVKEGVDYSALSNGENSVAFGGKRYDKLTDENRTATSAEGNQSFAAGASTHAYGDFDAVFGKDVKTYQKASFAAGDGALAAGYNTLARNAYSMAIGSGSSAESRYCFAGGYHATALNEGSFSYGSYTLSDGDYSAAFGVDTRSAGEYSFAGGKENKASGNGSISFGNSNISEGENSFTIGLSNRAKNINSIAMGYSNIAGGDSSVAIGQNNETVNAGSFALGIGNKACGTGEFVIGKYADNVYSDNKMFSVGAGESDSKRKTVFTVLTDGRAKVSGSPEDSDDVVRLGDLKSATTELNGQIDKVSKLLDNTYIHEVWIQTGGATSGTLDDKELRILSSNALSGTLRLFITFSYNSQNYTNFIYNYSIWTESVAHDVLSAAFDFRDFSQSDIKYVRYFLKIDLSNGAWTLNKNV